MTAGIPNNIGRQGENLATVVAFDLSDFVSTYGAGTPQLLVLRPGDRYPYPVALTVEGTNANWTITNTDTMIAGTGNAELRWYVDENTLAKSVLYSTQISKALVDPIAPPPPPPADNWLEQVLEAGSAAQAAQAEATQAASDAQTAQTGAETAQAAAETAQSNAETAQTGAETAATAAQKAQQATEDMTVSSQPGAAGTTPSVQKTTNPDTGVVNLEFTLPATLTKSSELINDADFQTGAQVAAAVAGKLDKSGGSMTGALAMSGNRITGLGAAVADGDAVTLTQLNEQISTNTAFFRGSFATYASLMSVLWQTSDPTAANYVTNNDYAYVADDESHNDEAWRYIYVLEDGGQNNGWKPQFKVNEAPMTVAQLAAINSGATAENIASIAGKVPIAQGVAHTGEFLAVGADGDVTLQNLPGDLYKIGDDLTATQVLSGNFNIAANLGKVYNLTSDLTVDNSTLSMFRDNKIGTYMAGTNLVVVQTGDALYVAVRQPLAPSGTIYYAEAGVTYYERNGNVYTQVTDVVVGVTDVSDYYKVMRDATYGFDMFSPPDTGAHVATNQGVAHAGEFLVVGADGNVTTQTLAAWQGGSY